MSCLVIGYGSIGKRHAQHLSELGSDVALLTSQIVSEYRCFATLKKALDSQDFNHIIVANPTHHHHETLEKLDEYNYQGMMLVEKPLYMNVNSFSDAFSSRILVGYNLRFHALLIAVKQLLENEEIVSFSAHVGQYLPSWRPDCDYRQSYSAKKSQGGGVLRDLSHEIDYCLWLCGPCQAVTAIGGQYSTLEVDSDDVYAIIMRCEKCPVVSLHLNYLNRTPRREIIIQTNQHTMLIDFIKGNLIINGEVKNQVFDEVKQTYQKEIKTLIDGDITSFTSYQQGLEVVKLIDAIEKANLYKRWIYL